MEEIGATGVARRELTVPLPSALGQLPGLSCDNGWARNGHAVILPLAVVPRTSQDLPDRVSMPPVARLALGGDALGIEPARYVYDAKPFYVKVEDLPNDVGLLLIDNELPIKEAVGIRNRAAGEEDRDTRRRGRVPRLRE